MRNKNYAMNPFITTGYKGAEYFCDRVKETENIVSLITNGNNVALISPRRLGKTDLLKHCFEQEDLKDTYYTFIIDIYSTKSLTEMVDKLGRSILKTLQPKGESAWNKFLSALKSIRSGISYDAAGVPSWTLELGEIKNPSVTLDEIFGYIESAEKPCVVAIDEFQQITRYEENNIEALLRTYVQNSRNANFIFSGSHRTMMAEIFVSPNRPFYQSVTLMSLDVIPQDVYFEFCREKFVQAGKGLSKDVVSDLYEMFDGVTFYLQRMMNEMFAMTPAGECCGVEAIVTALNKILDNSSYIYEDLLYQLPEKQSIVLKAIARENKAEKIMSADFVRKYSLGSASSVMSAVNGLLDKGILTKNRSEYFVYDHFLKFWLNGAQSKD